MAQPITNFNPRNWAMRDMDLEEFWPEGIVRRRAWGAQWTKQIDWGMRVINEVLMCHTNTDPCSTTEECSRVAREIQARDFDNHHIDINYNFLIGGDGKVYEGRGWMHTPELPEGYRQKHGYMMMVGFIGKQGTDPRRGELLAFEELMGVGVNQFVVATDYQRVEDATSCLVEMAHKSHDMDEFYPEKIVRRRDWEAEYTKHVDWGIQCAKDFLFCHTETEECTSKEECSKIVREVQSRHFEQNFNDINYNFLIGGDNNLYEGRGWLHTPELPKEHYLRHGIMMTIGFIGKKGSKPTDEQMAVFDDMVKVGARWGVVNPDYNRVEDTETW